MMLRRFWQHAKKYLDEQREHEPTNEEDMISGFMLFVFVVLWTLAGPQ